MNDARHIVAHNPELAVRLVAASTGLPTAEAVAWAADEFLTAPVREIHDPRHWAGMLTGHLERHYSMYGLADPPCLRTVKRHLTKWTEARLLST